MDDGLSDAHALSVAVREGADDPVRAIAQLAESQDLRKACLELGFAESLDLADPAQKLCDLHLSVERWVLRKKSDSLTKGVRSIQHVHAVNANLTRSWHQQAG